MWVAKEDDRTFQEVLDEFVTISLEQKENRDIHILLDLVAKTYGKVLLSKFVPDDNSTTNWQQYVRDLESEIYIDYREEQFWEMRGGRD